jgi:hypothetical protein
MLENAVHNITELRQVKNNADLEKTKTGIAFSYDQYSSLLLSAAAAYDTQATSKRSKHQVFNHEFFDHNNDMDTFDIETPVSTVQAYAAMTNQNKFAPSETKPRMSRDQWYTLNEKERLLRLLFWGFPSQHLRQFQAVEFLNARPIFMRFLHMIFFSSTCMIL